MPRLSLALVGVLSLVCVKGAQAQLVCERPLHQAGEVRGGAPLAHRFNLANRGSCTVEVTEVRPGCGCLQPRLERRVIPPGESTALQVEVNTLAQPGGPNTWRATLHYRDGDQPRELPLFVTALVVSEVTVRPAALLVSTDTAIGHELTLIDRRAQAFGVKAVLTTSRHVRASAGEPRRTDKGTWERTVALEVLPGCPEGRHEEMLHVHTTDADYPELKIPFTVVKRPRQHVTAVPATVHLTAYGQAPLPARIVLLGSSDDQEVQIERVEPASPAVRCSWAAGPGARATLKVEVDRTKVTGPSWESAVRVFLRKPGAQVVTVPVRCLLP